MLNLPLALLVHILAVSYAMRCVIKLKDLSLSRQDIFNVQEGITMFRKSTTSLVELKKKILSLSLVYDTRELSPKLSALSDMRNFFNVNFM